MMRFKLALVISAAFIVLELPVARASDSELKLTLKNSIEKIDSSYLERFGFKNIEMFEFLGSNSTSTDHQFTPVIIAYREAGWTAEKVQVGLLEAFNSFSRCNVNFVRGRLFIVDSPFGIVDYVEIDDKTIVSKNFELEIPFLPKPFIVLMGAHPKKPTLYGAANNKKNNSKDDLWLGTLFIFSKSDPQQVGQTFLSYTLTHELGHIFGLEHSEDELNTMYPKAYPGKKIEGFNDLQCEIIQKSTILSYESGIKDEKL